MEPKRYLPRHLANYPVEPFDNAQEAWFWFVRCQRLRMEGGRLMDQPVQTVRPCDPDDLYRAVISLARKGRISQAHLGVLGRYGIADRPPDPRCRNEQTAAHLWDDALDGLTTVLRNKGIVRTPEPREGADSVDSWGCTPDHKEGKS